VEAIRQVHAGKKRIPAQIAAQLAEHMSDEGLTARETEVLRRLPKETGIGHWERLFISEDTVKVHIKHIMESWAPVTAPKRSHRLAARNYSALRGFRHHRYSETSVKNCRSSRYLLEQSAIFRRRNFLYQLCIVPSSLRLTGR